MAASHERVVAVKLHLRNEMVERGGRRTYLNRRRLEPYPEHVLALLAEPHKHLSIERVRKQTFKLIHRDGSIDKANEERHG